MRRGLCLAWMGLAGWVAADPGDPTYYGQIGRLLQAKCTLCHIEGGLAPFSMETYEETVAESRLALIRFNVANRLMPPWNAALEQGFEPGQGFKPDRSLTQEQIDVLLGWVDAGGPAGDPEDAPPPIEHPDGWRFGEPDLVLEMAETWQMWATGGDVYRCFVLPTGFTEPTKIVGLQFQPDNLRIAHHAVLYSDPNNLGPARDAQQGGPNDGWDCFGGPGLSGSVVMGGWAPGGGFQPYTSELGFELPAGSNIIVQMHYHPSGVPETDRTRLGLNVSQDPGVRRLYQAIPTRIDFTVPAGAQGYQLTMNVSVPTSRHVIAVFPHMHTIGSTCSATAILPDSRQIPLIRIDRWDFDWQEFYVYHRPVALPAGTNIRVVGTWDNPFNHDVRGGLFTDQEMLTLGWAWTVDSEGGPPSMPDVTPPQVVGLEITRPGRGADIAVELSEPIALPHFPSAIDLRWSDPNLDQAPIRFRPEAIVTEGSILRLRLANAPGGGYTLTLRGFFGLRDPAENYLDANGNGVGGELADDMILPFTLPPPNETTPRWRLYRH